MPVWVGMRSARRRTIGVCTTFSFKKDFPLRAKGFESASVACLLCLHFDRSCQTCGPGVSTGGTGSQSVTAGRRHFKFDAGMAGGSPPRPGAAEDGPIASKTEELFSAFLSDSQWLSARDEPAGQTVGPSYYPRCSLMRKSLDGRASMGGTLRTNSDRG